jgi:hypothetical protein
LPVPPLAAPTTVNFGDLLKGLTPQEYTPIRPDSRFQEPNMTFDDGIDLNDTSYQALSDDKKKNIKC